MSGMDKAQKFCEEAHANGWTTKIEQRNDDEVHVEAERNSERITIFWRGNSLVETPFHYFMGQQKSLHNKATATRQLSLKPNPKGFRQGARQKIVDLKLTPMSGDFKDAELIDQETLEQIRQPLPFDPDNDTDSTILKALRGSTVVFVNRLSGRGESVHIPRDLNMNRNHFFLEDSVDGETYVSFLSASGFRSIYLNSIVRM